MTEEETTEETRIATLESIVEKLDRLSEAVFGGGKKDDPAPAPAAKAEDGDGEGVGAEVRKELARLKAAEDRKKRADEQAGEVAALKEQVKKITERPPREYRKVTRMMGWAGDDE